MQFLIAAFDLICFLRPLPLCGGVTKASAFGDTAFLREKAVRKRARGKPLDPTLSTPAKTVLHALRKGVRAVSYCGFRSGLLLAAAAALRRGFGSAAAQKENRPVKCTQSCTAVGTKAPPCGLTINRSAERCRSAARGRPFRA